MKIQVAISDNKVVVSLDEFCLETDIDELVKVIKDKLLEFNRVSELKVLDLMPKDSSKLVKFYCIDHCVILKCDDPKFGNLKEKAKTDFREAEVSKALIDVILDLHYQ